MLKSLVTIVMLKIVEVVSLTGIKLIASLSRFDQAVERSSLWPDFVNKVILLFLYSYRLIPSQSGSAVYAVTTDAHLVPMGIFRGLLNKHMNDDSRTVYEAAPLWPNMKYIEAYTHVHNLRYKQVGANHDHDCVKWWCRILNSIIACTLSFMVWDHCYSEDLINLKSLHVKTMVKNCLSLRQE